MKIKKVTAFAILVLISLPISSEAYWVWSPEAGKFVNTEGAVQDAADELYNSALQFYREKNFDAASEHLEELLKKFPSSSVASEAQYRLGVIYEEKGDYMRAFHAYKNLIQSYPQSERLSEVIEREYRIGNVFLSGKKGKLMGLEILPSLPRAVEIFRHIVEQAPYSDYGDKAYLRLGLAYKRWKRYEDALNAFQSLIEQYPQSPLVPDARYQLAETSFMRSTTEFRDQRALDDASSQVDSFLTQYPDTTTSETAAKLRQEIDEKNAEKNYRIGLYYEKENYLDSALIYYSDIAARYPHTEWGKKAAGKLQSLKEPAAYLTTQEAEIQNQIQIVEAQINGLTGEDKFEKDRLSRQLERLKERQKALEKNKGESLKRRHQDIQRREREIKEKFKKLEKKRKLLKKNPSEDLKLALDRWTASLEDEQAALAQEKNQLSEWRQTLGVKAPRVISLEFLPFIGEPGSALDQVREVEAKKFYKLSGDKKVLLSEKEVLYKQHGEVTALLKDLESRRSRILEEEMEFQGVAQLGGEALKERQEVLKETNREIKKLEQELEAKKALYEKLFGTPGWLGWTKVPAGVVTRSAGLVGQSVDRSLDLLNPFDAGPESLEDKKLEELLERQMHLKEKISAQQSLVETLSRAFDVELALQEQKRLREAFESEEDIDPRRMRKAVKRLEKDLRGRYEEIEDRHKHKKKLLEELDGVFKQREEEEGSMHRAAKAVSSPVTGMAKLSKAFLFGLPNKDVELTESAETLREDSETARRAKEIKEEIRMESLVIEAKSREIVTLQKELEILKAQASLAGGYKFRSAFVALPYQFVKEAVESAQRLVPKKDRDEALIQLLDRETRELESFKGDLKATEAVIRRKSGWESAAQSAPPEKPKKAQLKTIAQDQVPADAEGRLAQQSKLEAEINQLIQKLDIRRKKYEQERSFLEGEWRALNKEVDQSASRKEWGQEVEKGAEQEKKLHDELREIEKNLQDIIEKENKIEEEESGILEKRIEKIDEVIQKTHSKVMVQNLLTEREHMEGRLSQLALRRDFLTKELQRFRLPAEPPKANP